MSTSTSEPFKPSGEKPPVGKMVDRHPTAIAIAIAVLVVAAVGAAIWWFLIRDDDPSGTTAQGSVSSDTEQSDDGVSLVRVPSLAATAKVDGVPVDGPIDLTFGEESELVVTVVNDGNLTMDDITVTLEVAGDESDAGGTDLCELPVLAPDESSDCTLEFTPSADTTAVVARILGLGPLGEEVERTVDLAFG